MTTALSAFLATLLFAPLVQAQDDPIADRQEAMGDLSEAHKLLSAMVKGHLPFDPTAAASAMRTIAADAAKLPPMFPVGSESGEDTRASPAIWQNPNDFAAHIARLQASAQAAVPLAASGLAGFEPAYEAVAEACKACHAAYRLEKPAGSTVAP